MKFNCCNLNKILIISMVLLLSLSLNSLNAQITDQTISFSTSEINLVFQPPLRPGINSENPLHIELPQLNLAVNLFENYMQYLHKLKKIAPEVELNFIYAPGQTLDNWKDDSGQINLKNTGLNHILRIVNKYLSQKSSTDRTYLLDSSDSLLTIPDQFKRKDCKIALKLELENISQYKESLEPDTDLIVCSDKLVFSTRPHKGSNRIFKYILDNNKARVSSINGQSIKWFDNLTPDPNERFLAYSDNKQLFILNLQNGKKEKIFEDRKMLVLGMSWSPSSPVLAGLMLDDKTQERILFIYDAEQKKMLEIENIEQIEANYLYARPYWSPDGKKIALTSGSEIHIIDIENFKTYQKAVLLPNEISELIWSSDSKSFAVVEIIGQTRSRYVFDDLDLRKSILHRYRINEDHSVSEDHAQRIESRNTIKLVSFWTLDRVLYVEGRLLSKRLNTPIWDLSKTFSAFLTPEPSRSISREKGEKLQKTDPISLPMKYLYVFRNLDGKFENVYDAGFAHTNHVFADNFYNYWFIGLRKPEKLKVSPEAFNLRYPPYPFQEHNSFVFSEFSADKVLNFVKFLQGYNLRVTRFSPDFSKVFFLSNFCGPLNIWTGNFSQMVKELSE
ncbi:MAG: hypothetical protein ACQETH_09585 [Candidatus Rifleibacteriota bacterium]